jgi:hypothetical protein
MNFLKFVDRFFGEIEITPMPMERLSDTIDDKTFREELKNTIEEDRKKGKQKLYKPLLMPNYKLFKVY